MTWVKLERYDFPIISKTRPYGVKGAAQTMLATRLPCKHTRKFPAFLFLDWSHTRSGLANIDSDDRALPSVLTAWHVPGALQEDPSRLKDSRGGCFAAWAVYRPRYER